MTERSRGEPTPRDYNRQLRAVYDRIKPPIAHLEMDPAMLYAMSALTARILNGEVTKPQARRISTEDMFTKGSQEAVERERQERLASPELIGLEQEVSQLLYVHSSLTASAVEVAILQFMDDYADGRRMEDPIDSASEVRFSQYLILDMGEPGGEGVFSSDVDKVREIERTLYGAYLDWVEIGFNFDEDDLLKSWKEAFREKYGEVPFPNLEPKQRTLEEISPDEEF